MPRRVRTTVQLDPKLVRAGKRRATARGQTLSDLVSEGLARLIREDEADIALVRRRRNSPSRPYEEFVAELKRDGLL